MTPSDIMRAWKDPNYRAGLSATQRAPLPAHPAGASELPEPTLHAAWSQQADATPVAGATNVALPDIGS